MTPHESFCGKKPDVSHFKIFGCKAFMHVSKEERKKWDSKTDKCIFIGYSILNKGYDPKARIVHVSRDVLLQEDEFIRRKRKKEIVTLSNSDNEEEPPKINQPLSPPPSPTQRNEDTADDPKEATAGKKPK